MYVYSSLGVFANSLYLSDMFSLSVSGEWEWRFPSYFEEEPTMIEVFVILQKFT